MSAQGKTLVLIRHAKSSWKYEFLSDYDRPLNRRGLGDALLMAEQLKFRRRMPDLVVSSPAVRTYSTAAMIMKQLDVSSGKIQLEESLFHSSGNQYGSILKGIDNAHDVVFMVGHNPGISDFLESITNSEYVDLPTCCVTEVVFESNSWSEAVEQGGKMKYQLYPKMFKPE